MWKNWAFILRKCQSTVPLKICEAVLEEMLNNYQYLRDWIAQHIYLRDEGMHDKYRNLEPKSTYKFLDYLF